MLWVFWPIGLYLLFKRLSFESADRYQNEPHHRFNETYGAYDAQVNSTEKPKKKRRKSSGSEEESRQKRIIRILTIIGAFFAFFGTMSVAFQLGDWLSYGYLWLDELIPSLFLGCGLGGGMLFTARRLKKRMELLKRYTAIIGKRKVMSLSEIAYIESSSLRKVTSDLKDLLAMGAFPNAYIDHSRKLLVLSTVGLDDDPVYQSASGGTKKEADPPAADALTEKDSYLREIRRLNDEIADDELSQKIDRIEELTDKMFTAVERAPEKRAQLSSFLNYYLPTTLKILGAYRDFENQTARGENISSAMQDIENIMSTLVSGFERQLDLLFEGDALDISTDISVLEGMLKKDGLSDSSPLSMK